MTQQRSIETVRVALGSRSYEVLIGSGLLGAALEHITQHLGGTPRTFIVTDENLAHTHLDQLQAVLSAHNGLRGTMVLPAGESTKCFAQLEALCAEILAAGVERDDCIVALGGGVIGDLAGFAAAIVRRGLRYVQLPTSLLAQVDSSVGGKTAINTGHGKNLIGAFHQPHLVLADIDVLSTLPAREMHAGYGEVAKYGLLGDRDFFDWLDGNVERIFARDTAALAYAVRRSIDMKAEIVARDETEQGDRALLNLGHTFGHALEAWTGYSTALLHGEAVSIGMCLAFRLSEELGHCAPQTAAQVTAHLKRAGLPTEISEVTADQPANADRLLEHMMQDKKVRSGRLTFILAHAIGQAFITRDISQNDARAFLARQIAS